MPSWCITGLWFSPEREMLQAAVDLSQEKVSGTVRLKLYKGNAMVVGRRSANSLYRKLMSTFEDDAGAYDQKDAEGFIKLNDPALRLLREARPLVALRYLRRAVQYCAARATAISNLRREQLSYPLPSTTDSEESEKLEPCALAESPDPDAASTHRNGEEFPPD